MSNAAQAPLLWDEGPSIGEYSGPSRPAGNVIALPPKQVLLRRTPHWYQREAVDDLNQRFGRGSKAELLVLPTGTGKTFVASMFVNQCQERREPVLILCNRDKLIKQMFDDLNDEGVCPLIEQARHRALHHFGTHGNIVLASVQTLRGERLQSWPRDAFKWIISDEAHNCACDQWRAIIDHFKDAKHLGLTATPFRTDNRSLKDDFAFPWVRKLTLREAIEGKFLSRIRVHFEETDIDLCKVGIVGKDFDYKELDRVIWRNTAALATAIRRLAVRADGAPRSVVGFTPHVNSAEGIAAALRDIGGRAASISWRSDNVDALYERFKPKGDAHLGDLEYLMNVSILAEGFNAPWLECVALCRPTLSPGVVTQQIGRVTRLSHKTGKKDGLILEFGMKSNKNLAATIDAILDGVDDEETPTKERQAYTAQVRARTQQILHNAGEMDLIEAHDLAKSQLAEEERLRRERIELTRAKYREVELPTFHSYTYDPFAGLHNRQLEMGELGATEWATQEQIDLIAELSGGVVPGHQLSRAAAEKRIQQLQIQKRYRYATEKQKRLMINTLHCDPRKAARMRTWEASQWMDNRRLEMVNELVESHGYEQAALNEMKIWELAKLYDRLAQRPA